MARLNQHPGTDLSLAWQRYAEALQRRDRFTPGDPGYHDAVHDVGVRWSQIQTIRRQTAMEMGRAAEPGAR